jgi:putative transposase
MGFGDRLMKVVVKVGDVVELIRRFEASPAEAMSEVVAQFRRAASSTLEQLMETELALFLGQPAETENKRNGYSVRSFALKGVGVVQVRMPRDRAGRFESRILPKHLRYDPALEKDVALLHLAGLSTRMLSAMSTRILGMKVSAAEVSNALKGMLPAAKGFLERPLAGRRWQYLYLDGTNFHIRRSTVEREPTLVVVGVDEVGCKSVLAMVQGDKESRASWEMVFASIKERGLDTSAVQLGIMDGLPGLGDAFTEGFPRARAARCWVHKARNVFPRVPRRYQADFKVGWDAVAYAEGRTAACDAFEALKGRWAKTCEDAIACMERDLEALLAHYDFPKSHWEALRTTNPIERVNKEFKRRSKAMETMGPDGLKALLAFTALRIEYGWATTPINSNKLSRLVYRQRLEKHLEEVTKALLN